MRYILKLKYKTKTRKTELALNITDEDFWVNLPIIPVNSPKFRSHLRNIQHVSYCCSGLLLLQKLLDANLRRDVASLDTDYRLASHCYHYYWKRPCYLPDHNQTKTQNKNQLVCLVTCSGRLCLRSNLLSAEIVLQDL